MHFPGVIRTPFDRLFFWQFVCVSIYMFISSLSFSLSYCLYFSIYLYVCLSIHMFTFRPYVYISLTVCISVILSVWYSPFPSVFLSSRLSLSTRIFVSLPSVCHCNHLAFPIHVIYLFVLLSPHLSVHLSTRLSISLPLLTSLYLSNYQSMSLPVTICLS